MIDATYAGSMAEYNRWMNQRLYELCAGIPDAERKADRGAYFGSIHATLNHLLFGDLAWLSRFTGDPPELPALGAILHDEWDDLAQARIATDERLIAWAAGLDETWLARPFSFRSVADGRTWTVPTWIVVAHVFNHQTHHRGQLTTLLSQLGHDPGVTDLTKVPALQLAAEPAR